MPNLTTIKLSNYIISEKEKNETTIRRKPFVFHPILNACHIYL